MPSRIIALLLMLPIFLASAAAAAVLEPPVFQDGGYLVSKEGRLLAAHQPDRLLIPASTWKIATALLALERLGPNYRFPTIFYQAGDDLIIQGRGDPLLVSEEVAAIAAELAAAGVTAVDDLILDDSYFRLEQPRPAGAGNSRRAYDAANSALVVNFNTVHLQISAAGTVRSAEQQTPTLPVMRELAKGLPPGRHRLNLARPDERTLRHSGELFRQLLRTQGIKVNGRLRAGKVPAGGREIHRHYSSRPLTEVVAQMLLYSNNFVANQLLLAVAAQQQPPASWEQGRRLLQDFLKEKGLPAGSYQVAEGSGLSRRNRITPRALWRLLELFKPWATLLPRQPGRLLKSGTLTGVYAYAGYFAGDGNDGAPALDPVVLILQQPTDTREQALELLEQYYRQSKR
ncbi:MAG: D-alanyl-D-alanine carboxypeptidase [Desulfurivibrio sp.]|nr:D-alanyl-D-alanine carboxypeptidase [Desulfurivibrio sp.]